MEARSDFADQALVKTRLSAIYTASQNAQIDRSTDVMPDVGCRPALTKERRA